MCKSSAWCSRYTKENVTVRWDIPAFSLAQERYRGKCYNEVRYTSLQLGTGKVQRKVLQWGEIYQPSAWYRKGTEESVTMRWDIPAFSLVQERYRGKCYNEVRYTSLQLGTGKVQRKVLQWGEIYQPSAWYRKGTEESVTVRWDIPAFSLAQERYRGKFYSEVRYTSLQLGTGKVQRKVLQWGEIYQPSAWYRKGTEESVTVRWDIPAFSLAQERYRGKCYNEVRYTSLQLGTGKVQRKVLQWGEIYQPSAWYRKGTEESVTMRWDIPAFSLVQERYRGKCYNEVRYTSLQLGTGKVQRKVLQWGEIYQPSAWCRKGTEEKWG